jgi:hypothetical protein
MDGYGSTNFNRMCNTFPSENSFIYIVRLFAASSAVGCQARDSDVFMCAPGCSEAPRTGENTPWPLLVAYKKPLVSSVKRAL